VWPVASLRPKPRTANVFSKIFTWWNGATIGTLFTIAKHGRFVGEDEQGNRYYEAKTDKGSYDVGRKRRWVTYNGYAEASKVSPDWHGWLHHTFEEPPTVEPLLRRKWEKDHLPNMSGTPYAWRPQGSLARKGERPAATGDYEAWKPD
jgi:NADH:ubiquinone oxidoreductase subunit